MPNDLLKETWRPQRPMSLPALTPLPDCAPLYTILWQPVRLPRRRGPPRVDTPPPRSSPVLDVHLSPRKKLLGSSEDDDPEEDNRASIEFEDLQPYDTSALSELKEYVVRRKPPEPETPLAMELRLSNNPRQRIVEPPASILWPTWSSNLDVLVAERERLSRIQISAPNPS
jgi:hypothetical protein